ncbi:nudix domain-containing protein [Apodospora peruviana]|uniref:Nudix domain-containing protein n=1 Tax=Apodospora peruviana TaxID=516989 RepID=A0AAE0HUE4_9PEZI|nr:nudix domain-containing protein [Apodospora peruviana]
MAAAVNPHPRVAVIGIISDDQGRVCAGRRIGPLGGGGHLEYGEDIFACVERETLEETGLVVRGLKVVGVTNDVFVENNKHYITIWTICERADPEQQPERLEPNKCEGWAWKGWDEIKADASDDEKAEEKNLFLPLANLVRDFPDIDVIVASALADKAQQR